MLMVEKIDYTGNINVNKSTLAGDKGNANGIGIWQSLLLLQIIMSK